jgi:phage gpG-like protein
MSRIDVSADTREVDATLRDLRERAQDPTPAFEAIGRLLVNRIRLCFRQSRSPWGVPWLPIKFRAPAVQKIKKDGTPAFTASGRKQLAANNLAAQAKGSAGKPLVDSGALRNSLTYFADRDGVEIGTVAKQARLQHFGGRIVPKRAKVLAFAGPGGELILSRGVTIPARPFMPINPQGQLMLPPSWRKGVLAEIAKHFEAVS